MTKKTKGKPVKTVPEFFIGDRVEIKYFAPGVITELRGPLGPDGAQVYRVRYMRKPRPAYIEVLGSQLKLIRRPEPKESKPQGVPGERSGQESTSNGDSGLEKKKGK
jgi:hypothetical protein